MSRNAPVRVKKAQKVLKSVKVMKIAADLIKTVTIAVPCMAGCGKNLQVRVEVATIIPHLGRPRGLRKRCYACALRTNTNGMIPNATHM